MLANGHGQLTVMDVPIPARCTMEFNIGLVVHIAYLLSVLVESCDTMQPLSTPIDVSLYESAAIHPPLSSVV